MFCLFSGDRDRDEEMGKIGRGRLIRDRIPRNSDAAEASWRHLSSCKERDNRNMKREENTEKTEKRVLRSKSFPASSEVTRALEISRTSSEPELGPHENNSSTHGRAMNGDRRRTTMATAEMCAKQLSQLLSPQRCHAIEQLNNTPNWTCDMSAHNHALSLVNTRMPTEIFTENLFGKPRI